MARRIAGTPSDFEHIRERMEQAYQRLLGGSGRPNFCPPYMEPAVDVYQTEGEVVVLVEMAGIPEEEVLLEVEGRTLVIRGVRRPLPGPRQREYTQIEITTGPFQRELHLPSEVNPELAKAVYKNGILEIVMPKAAPAMGRHLKIVVH